MRFFLFIFVDFREAKIKRGFRVLRDTAQGSALRTRKPFEKGLSESFISPAGGAYSFTAPAVRDDTTCSWKIAKTAIDGITAIVMAANIAV